MILCVATYGKRVASLLETASELHFYEITELVVRSRGFGPNPSGGPAELVVALQAAGVKTLVCGGINDAYAQHCKHAGIRLVPWIAGDLESVVEAWIRGDITTLVMPGCPKRATKGKERHQL